jgi:hypothetical protein
MHDEVKDIYEHFCEYCDDKQGHAATLTLAAVLWQLHADASKELSVTLKPKIFVNGQEIGEDQ